MMLMAPPCPAVLQIASVSNGYIFPQGASAASLARAACLADVAGSCSQKERSAAIAAGGVIRGDCRFAGFHGLPNWLPGSGFGQILNGCGVFGWRTLILNDGFVGVDDGSEDLFFRVVL